MTVAGDCVRGSVAARNRGGRRVIDLRQIARLADVEGGGRMHAALADDLAIEQRLIVVIDLDEHHRRPRRGRHFGTVGARSEEHTSELQSLMRISYAVFCLKKKNKKEDRQHITKT